MYEVDESITAIDTPLRDLKLTANQVEVRIRQATERSYEHHAACERELAEAERLQVEKLTYDEAIKKLEA